MYIYIYIYIWKYLMEKNAIILRKIEKQSNP